MAHTPDPLHFCITCGQPIGSEEVAAEMLAALKWFIDDLSRPHTVMLDFDANVVRARAAILKAEGG